MSEKQEKKKNYENNKNKIIDIVNERCPLKGTIYFEKEIINEGISASVFVVFKTFMLNGQKVSIKTRMSTAMLVYPRKKSSIKDIAQCWIDEIIHSYFLLHKQVFKEITTAPAPKAPAASERI